MSPREVVNQIHAQHWDYSLPVNPISIANSMGVKVYSSESMGTFSGYYDADTNAIVVNSGDSTSRQRFSIAHELGHSAMGHGSSPRDNSQQFNQYHYDPKEVAANIFAAELLMPGEAVRTMVEQRELTFQQLCEKFDVSSSAMRIRLESLGYLS